MFSQTPARKNNAVICFSETKLGLMPDWGGGAALTRLIGHSRAADLILTGRKVSADEACSLGLVNKISAKGNALNESVAIAEKSRKTDPAPSNLHYPLSGKAQIPLRRNC